MRKYKIHKHSYINYAAEPTKIIEYYIYERFLFFWRPIPLHIFFDSLCYPFKTKKSAEKYIKSLKEI